VGAAGGGGGAAHLRAHGVWGPQQRSAPVHHPSGPTLKHQAPSAILHPSPPTHLLKGLAPPVVGVGHRGHALVGHAVGRHERQPRPAGPAAQRSISTAQRPISTRVIAAWLTAAARSALSAAAARPARIRARGVWAALFGCSVRGVMRSALRGLHAELGGNGRGRCRADCAGCVGGAELGVSNACSTAQHSTATEQAVACGKRNTPAPSLRSSTTSPVSHPTCSRVG
jgi:hypothetical protein